MKKGSSEIEQFSKENSKKSDRLLELNSTKILSNDEAGTSKSNESQATTKVISDAGLRRVKTDKSEEIKFLAGPSNNLTGADVSVRNSGEIHENERGIPSEGESFVIFPLPATSEDVRNENFTAHHSIVNTSIWELPVESREETIHNLTVETASAESILNLTVCSVKPNPNNEAGAVHDLELNFNNEDIGTETEERIDEGTSTAELNPMRCVQVIADWPSQNRDFELLAKLDDEYSADPCCPSHQISDVFDPEEWFRPDLGDDDIPPGRRLRRESGTFFLNISK